MSIPQARLALHPRLRLVVIGLIAIYLSLTGGAWWFVRYHRGVGSITYWDIALPTNWERYQIKRGNHLIALAEQLLQTNQSSRGIQYLRMGLARAPDNRDGRLLLSQLFARNNRTDLAKETLLTGLKYHRSDLEYLATTLRLLIDQQDDTSALRLCHELLNASSSARKIIALAAINAATIQYNRGDFDMAESLLKRHQADATLQGRLLHAQIEWDRGYRELALVLLRKLHHDYPASELIYSHLQKALRSESLASASRRFAILHQITYPERPGSYLDQLRSLDAEKDEAAVIHAAQNMIDAFAGKSAPLLELGDFAATTGNVAIAESLNSHFQQNNLPESNLIRLLLIEALLNAEQYEEVLQETARLSTSRIDQVANTAKGLEAIAYYGLGDPGSGLAQLTAFLAQPQLRPDSVFAIADHLASLGHSSTAQDMLTQALQRSPQSQLILTRLLELELKDRKVNSASVHLRTLLSMRRPSPKILSEALNLLQSDRFLFLDGRADLIGDLEASLGKR